MDGYIDAVLDAAEIWSREVLRHDHEWIPAEENLLESINNYLNVLRNPKIPRPPNLPDFKTKRYSHIPTKPTPSPTLRRYVDHHAQKEFKEYGTYLTSLETEYKTVQIHIFSKGDEIIAYVMRGFEIPVAQGQAIVEIALKQFPQKKKSVIYELMC